MAYTTFCLAMDETHARNLVRHLRRVGFTAGDISIGMHESGEEDESDTDPLIVLAPDDDGDVGGPPADDGGWPAGAEPILVPGVGPMVIGGPLRARLGVPGTAGLPAVAGALTTFGMSLVDARRFDGRLWTGHVLVAAHSLDPRQDERARVALLAGGGMYLTESLRPELPGPVPPGPSVRP